MGTTRFSGPVMYSGNGSENEWFENLPIGVNPDYVCYYDDFTGIDIDDTDDWTKSVLNSGTVTLLGDHVGGWAKIAGSGSHDNSGGSLQGNEIWMAQANKNIYFEASVAMSKPADSDLFVGLAENGTLATGVPFTANNQIGFIVVEGSGSIFGNVDSGGSDTALDTGVDMAAAAESGSLITNSRRLGFIARGTGSVEWFVDRKSVGTTTTNIPTVALTQFLAGISGSTAADVHYCDYIWVVQQRTTDGMVQYDAQP
jgi:hypothetical protein